MSRRLLVLAAAVLWASACGTELKDAEEARSFEQAKQELNTFDPLPNGIQWKMDDRFPSDSDGDGVREERNDDAAYLQPETHGGYRVVLDGCGPGSGSYTYTWNINGQQVQGPGYCQVPFFFPTQGEFPVSLTISGYGTSRMYTQTVRVRDYLIVSLGDSFGSGEGAPDVQANWDLNQGPQWANKRCHRSFNSPSAKAALALEESDPHSSVTYVSFACSGATISRVTYDGGQFPLEGFADHTNGTWEGAGLLLGYVGIEDKGLTPLLPQVEEMVTKLGNQRPIDVLVMSAGGNDVGFGDILRFCLVHSQCTWGDDGQSLRSKVDPLKGELPGRYQALADRFAMEGLNIRSVQLMEYPDLTRNRDGSICPEMLQDVKNNLSMEVSHGEMVELEPYVFTPLLDEMRASAARHGWAYVHGIADDFAGRGRSPIGRGYCLPWYERWINTANDSVGHQGPEGEKTQTKGTAHPNAHGFEAMAQRLQDSIFATLPELAPDGTLLQDNVAGAIYVVYGGARFPIPSMQWFEALGFDAANVHAVPGSTIARFPVAPRDGTLLHDPGTGVVFVTIGGAKFAIADPAQFAALGYDWANVRTVPAGTVAQVPDAPRDGTLMHDRLAGSVYVALGGARIPVANPDQFEALGYRWSDIRNVPEHSLAALPTVPRNGTLYRTEADGRVFLVDGGARFHIPDTGYAQRMGWDVFTRVQLAPSTGLQLPYAPKGHVDVGGTNGILTGWAFDQDVPAQPISIHVYIDGPAGVGQFMAADVTDVHRADVNAYFSAEGLSGTHGFELNVPAQYRDGQAHRLFVYALDHEGRYNPFLDAMGYEFRWY